MKLPPAMIVLALAVAAPACRAVADEVPVAESWRFNSRAQTDAALESLSADDPSTAVERFASAHRLDPGNPLTIFNEATGKLLAQHPDALAELSEAAAELPPDLASVAFYNLGNAHLERQDPTAAVESYKNALRLEPGLFDAKFNLELALRMLEHQQREQQQDGRQNDSESQDQSPSSEETSDDVRQEEQPSSDSEQPSPDTPDDSQPESGESDQDESEREGPLPDFEEQQDMTAEQAAAILEAIENLERDQRRKQAEERARRRAREGKDW